MVENRHINVIDEQSFKQEVEGLHFPEQVTKTEFLQIAELIYRLVLALVEAEADGKDFDDNYEKEMDRITRKHPWTTENYLVTSYTYFGVIALIAQGKEVKAPLTGTGWTGKKRQKAG